MVNFVCKFVPIEVTVMNRSRLVIFSFVIGRNTHAGVSIRAAYFTGPNPSVTGVDSLIRFFFFCAKLGSFVADPSRQHQCGQQFPLPFNHEAGIQHNTFSVLESPLPVSNVLGLSLW